MSNVNRHLFQSKMMSSNTSLYVKFDAIMEYCIHGFQIPKTGVRQHLYAIVPASKGFSFIEFFKFKISFTKLVRTC